MKTISTISFILLCSTVNSQSLTVNQTVDYINKYLPQLLSGTGTLGAKIYNPKIECDVFGNITYKATLDYPDEPGKYKKEINRVFSVKDANYIWVYATTYSDGSFAGYQIRIEKSKLSVPIFTFEITDKDDGEKICKALLHLKSITKADPFK